MKSRRFKKPNYFIGFFQCILFHKADLYFKRIKTSTWNVSKCLIKWIYLVQHGATLKLKYNFIQHPCQNIYFETEIDIMQNLLRRYFMLEFFDYATTIISYVLALLLSLNSVKHICNKTDQNVHISPIQLL